MQWRSDTECWLLIEERDPPHHPADGSASGSGARLLLISLSLTETAAAVRARGVLAPLEADRMLLASTAESPRCVCQCLAQVPLRGSAQPAAMPPRARLLCCPATSVAVLPCLAQVPLRMPTHSAPPPSDSAAFADASPAGEVEWWAFDSHRCDTILLRLPNAVYMVDFSRRDLVSAFMQLAWLGGVRDERTPLPLWTRYRIGGSSFKQALDVQKLCLPSGTATCAILALPPRCAPLHHELVAWAVQDSTHPDDPPGGQGGETRGYDNGDYDIEGDYYDAQRWNTELQTAIALGAAKWGTEPAGRVSALQHQRIDSRGQYRPVCAMPASNELRALVGAGAEPPRVRLRFGEAYHHGVMQSCSSWRFLVIVDASGVHILDFLPRTHWSLARQVAMPVLPSA